MASAGSKLRAAASVASRSRLEFGALALVTIGATAWAGRAQAEEAKRPPAVEVTPADYKQRSLLHDGHRSQGSFAWGDNSAGLVSPGDKKFEMVRKPKPLPLLDGLALRDLALADDYAVAVDSKGDVLQWGYGYDAEAPTDRPHRTLRDKNIVQVAVTPNKVYALAKSGKVYVFASSKDRQQSNASSSPSRSWWELITLAPQAGLDYAELTPNVKLASGEKIAELAAGRSHLLARTSKGRCFAAPADLRANKYGALGVRAVTLSAGEQMLYPDGFEPDDGVSAAASSSRAKPAGLIASQSFPRAWLPPEALDQVQQTLPDAPTTSSRDDGSSVLAPQELDIRFSTTLHEIASLQGLQVEQVAAGDKHSVVRTSEGRVLAFGGNNYGQLGLGTSMSFPIIPTPTEVALSRNYPKGYRTSCSGICAGGDSTYFLVDTEELRTRKVAVDVLACGHGQWGGIGNGQWSHQGAAARVKTISGLQEWSEKANAILPISIHDLSVGKTHTVVTLDNAVFQNDARYGRDVFIWGHNAYYQLGNGKRSNQSVPQHLPPLPHPTTAVNVASEESYNIESRMPHNRLQLAPPVKVGGHRIEERIKAGTNVTMVYWRIVD